MLGFQTIVVTCVTAAAVITYGVCRLSGRRSARSELQGEICAERESLRCAMAALPEQLELAKRSRTPDEGATESWFSELEADLVDARALESQLPAAEVEVADQSGMELDLRLAEILTLSIRVNRLADKYSLSSADAQDMEQPQMPPEPPRVLEPSLSAIAP